MWRKKKKLRWSRWIKRQNCLQFTQRKGLQKETVQNNQRKTNKQRRRRRRKQQLQEKSAYFWQQIQLSYFTHSMYSLSVCFFHYKRYTPPASVPILDMVLKCILLSFSTQGKYVQLWFILSSSLSTLEMFWNKRSGKCFTIDSTSEVLFLVCSNSLARKCLISMISGEHREKCLEESKNFFSTKFLGVSFWGARAIFFRNLQNNLRWSVNATENKLRKKHVLSSVHWASFTLHARIRNCSHQATRCATSRVNLETQHFACDIAWRAFSVNQAQERRECQAGQSSRLTGLEIWREILGAGAYNHLLKPPTTHSPPNVQKLPHGRASRIKDMWNIQNSHNTKKAHWCDLRYFHTKANARWKTLPFSFCADSVQKAMWDRQHNNSTQNAGSLGVKMPLAISRCMYWKIRKTLKNWLREVQLLYCRD